MTVNYNFHSDDVSTGKLPRKLRGATVNVTAAQAQWCGGAELRWTFSLCRRESSSAVQQLDLRNNTEPPRKHLGQHDDSDSRLPRSAGGRLLR